MQPIWTGYIAVAILALLICLACVGAVIFVCLRFFEKVDTEYDSATDWPAPPAEHRRERGGWQHMSAEERRAKFEDWCG